MNKLTFRLSASTIKTTELKSKHINARSLRLPATHVVLIVYLVMVKNTPDE
jgi:hypothetical protein